MERGGHCLIGYPYPGSPWVAWQERLERGRFLDDPVGRVVGVLEPASTPGCEHDRIDRTNEEARLHPHRAWWEEIGVEARQVSRHVVRLP